MVYVKCQQHWGWKCERRPTGNLCSFEVDRQAVATQVALDISAKVTELRLQWVVRHALACSQSVHNPLN